MTRLKDPKASVPDTVQKFLELTGSTYSLYKTAMTEKKRRILQIVTSNFAVCSGTLDFAYAIPFNEVAEREKNTDGRAAGNRTQSLRTRSARTTGILQPVA